MTFLCKKLSKKNIIKEPQNIFPFFLFLTVLKKKSPQCKHLAKNDTTSYFGFTHSSQGKTLSKTCHCCNGFPSLNALIPIFCLELQQQPLISLATKDFDGLFRLFSRVLALQNLSVLREVPIPPYSREGGSSGHVLSPGVP